MTQHKSTKNNSTAQTEVGQDVQTLKSIREKQKQILSTVVDYADTIHDSAWMLYGISGWFKAYVKSENWQRLSDESKDEAFDLFESLKFALIDLTDETGVMHGNVNPKLSKL